MNELFLICADRLSEFWRKWLWIFRMIIMIIYDDYSGNTIQEIFHIYQVVSDSLVYLQVENLGITWLALTKGFDLTMTWYLDQMTWAIYTWTWPKAHSYASILFSFCMCSHTDVGWALSAAKTEVTYTQHCAWTHLVWTHWSRWSANVLLMLCSMVLVQKANTEGSPQLLLNTVDWVYSQCYIRRGRGIFTCRH